MSSSLCSFLLFVFLTLQLTANTAFAARDNHHLHKVRVVSALPKNKEPMQLSYNNHGPPRNLGAGDSYSWSVGNKAVSQCYAVWELKFASWDAFHPRRDANHGSVFWVVKEAGFFLSWDNSTWVKKASWETE